eukprot:g9658.t1
MRSRRLGQDRSFVRAQDLPALKAKRMEKAREAIEENAPRSRVRAIMVPLQFADDDLPPKANTTGLLILMRQILGQLAATRLRVSELSENQRQGLGGEEEDGADCARLLPFLLLSSPNPKLLTFFAMLEAASCRCRCAASFIQDRLTPTPLHPQLHHPASRAWHEPVVQPQHLVYPLFVSMAENDVPIQGFAPNIRWGAGVVELQQQQQPQQPSVPGPGVQQLPVLVSLDGPGNASSTAATPKSLLAELDRLIALGLASIMLFGVVPDGLKDERGSGAADPVCSPVTEEVEDEEKQIQNPLATTTSDGNTKTTWNSSSRTSTSSMSLLVENPVVFFTKAIRRHMLGKYGDADKLLIMADVCLCEYTDHGHCGILRDDFNAAGNVVPTINNHATLARLSDIAVKYATAGVHWVCPSDMMDGRVAAIRTALNRANFPHVGILSYTSKKASSSLYAPFRLAVKSTFQGDRKRYQQPVGSYRIAQKAFQRDVGEGADIVLVKPSLFYTDIIRSYKEKEKDSGMLIAAYVVSGEYKMLKDYGENCGCVDSIVDEAHVSLLRAGADILVTYFTPWYLERIEGAGDRG